MSKKFLLTAGLLGGMYTVYEGAKTAFKSADGIGEIAYKSSFKESYELSRNLKERGELNCHEDKTAQYLLKYMTHMLKRFGEVVTEEDILFMLCEHYWDKKKSRLSHSIDTDLIKKILSIVNVEYCKVYDEYIGRSAKKAEAVKRSKRFKVEQRVAIEQLRDCLKEELLCANEDVVKLREVQVKLCSLTDYIETRFNRGYFEMLAIAEHLQDEAKKQVKLENKEDEKDEAVAVAETTVAVQTEGKKKFKKQN